MNWRDYITTDPTIMFGEPVVAGTRIPVDLLLEKMGNGETVDYLLLAYPHLSKEALLACFLFAAETVKNELMNTFAVLSNDNLRIKSPEGK